MCKELQVQNPPRGWKSHDIRKARPENLLAPASPLPTGSTIAVSLVPPCVGDTLCWRKTGDAVQLCIRYGGQSQFWPLFLFRFGQWPALCRQAFRGGSAGSEPHILRFCPGCVSDQPRE